MSVQKQIIIGVATSVLAMVIYQTFFDKDNAKQVEKKPDAFWQW